MPQTNRKWIIAGFCTLLCLLIAGFTAERYLAALHPEAAGILLVYLMLMLAPQISLCVCKTEDVFRCFAALMGGALVPLLVFGGGVQVWLMLCSFVLLILAVATIFFAIVPTLGRVSGFVLTMFFFSSFLWTGRVLDEGFSQNIAVWLSPQAMICAAYENFSFAHLPDVYNMWLGPVAPLPASWWLAMTYYLVPALLLLELTLVCKRIWRDA